MLYIVLIKNKKRLRWMVNWSCLSVGPGEWLVGSFLVTVFLLLGVYFGYRTIAAMRYGDSDLQKYGKATLVFLAIYSMIMIGLIIGK